MVATSAMQLVIRPRSRRARARVWPRASADSARVATRAPWTGHCAVSNSGSQVDIGASMHHHRGRRRPAPERHLAQRDSRRPRTHRRSRPCLLDRCDCPTTSSRRPMSRSPTSRRSVRRADPRRRARRVRRRRDADERHGDGIRAAHSGDDARLGRHGALRARGLRVRLRRRHHRAHDRAAARAGSGSARRSSPRRPRAMSTASAERIRCR